MKVYCLLTQNIDPLPESLVDFRYNLKMSSASRQQLRTEESDAVRKHFLQLSPVYSEIVRPGPRSRAVRRVHMNDQIKESLTKLKDTDFADIHGALPIAAGQSEAWEAVQAKMIKDVRFLEGINIMDYSLVVTVARVKRGESKSMLIPADEDEEEQKQKRPGPAELHRVLIEEEEKMSDAFSRLQRSGNCLFSPSGNFAYVFGIVDTLQECDVGAGAAGKGPGRPEKPPNTYAARFLGKLGSVFSVEGRYREHQLELSILATPKKKVE